MFVIRQNGISTIGLWTVAGLIAACAGLWAASEENQPPDHTITLTDITFQPKRLAVSVNDTVRFINKDDFEHDVYLVRTANRNDVLVPATTIPPGKSITVKIGEEGLFSLYCTIHGGMSGKITTTGSFELTEEEKKRAAARKVLPPIVKTGEDLFWGHAQCHQCHAMGERGDGIRGPNLDSIGFRSGARAKKLGLESGTAYIIQSLLEPSAHVVEGYSDDMPKVYQPPISMGENQLKAVIAYLQSKEGTVDTWAIDLDAQKLTTQPALNPFRKGDPQRGALVFDKMECYSCHTVGDRKAHSVGPDLTEIGAFRNWTWLAQSVIDPNAEVAPIWKSASVERNLDRDSDAFWSEESVVSGILRKNSTKEIKLLVRPGEMDTFTRAQVKKLKISKLSKMPADYSELMTFKEMADLISYLETLKGRKAGPARGPKPHE